MSEMVLWRDGSLADPREGVMSAKDPGLLVGAGVFETMMAYDGRTFAFGRHYRRLVKSGEVMGFEVGGEQELRDGVEAVIGALHDVARIRLRVTVSCKANGGGQLFVTGVPFSRWPPTADVVIVPWCRNEKGALAGVKSISYGENWMALDYAKRRGGSEAIFGNTRGELCEGAGSNVFVCWDGQWMTPPLDGGCLAGVTRKIVMELAEKRGIEVAEKAIPLKKLEDADEVFLTSTTREVQPVARVDGRSLGTVGGEGSQILAAAFSERYAQILMPKWQKVRCVLRGDL